MYMYVPEEMIRGIVLEIKPRWTMRDSARLVRERLGRWLETKRPVQQQIVVAQVETRKSERLPDLPISESAKQDIAFKAARLYRAYLRADDDRKDEAYREYRLYRDICTDLGVGRLAERLVQEYDANQKKQYEYNLVYRDGSTETVIGPTLAEALTSAGRGTGTVANIENMKVVAHNG